MTPPLPLTWVDGIAAFRAIEGILVTNAVARPGEAVDHDDELMKLRLHPTPDGCSVDDFTERVNTAMLKHIPFLARPFPDQKSTSMWVIQQLPPSLAVDGRGLVRTMTAAQLDDTPYVTEQCIDLVAVANDSNKNFKEITEMIGAAVTNETPDGRRPGGLGKGAGRGGKGAGGKGAGSGGKGTGGKGAGGRSAGGKDTKERATACSVQPPRGPMCDRMHHNECWRDPKSTVALPPWMMAKPDQVALIDKDKAANGARLNESVMSRKAAVAGEFAGTMTEDDMAQAWDCDSEVIGVFDDVDASGETALATPVRCSICSTAPCACDRFISAGTGFDGGAKADDYSGWFGRELDARCTTCEFALCACDLVDMRSAQRKAAVNPIFSIGEEIRWLTRDEVVVPGKIIAPCNANGDARVLDHGGNSHLINKSWIFRGGGSTGSSEISQPIVGTPRAHTDPRPATRLSSAAWADMQAIKQGQSAVVEMRQLHETSLAVKAAARMAELTRANAALLAEIQRASVERDTLAASVLQSAFQRPDTPCTEASFEEDVAPGDGEVVQPSGDN